MDARRIFLSLMLITAAALSAPTAHGARSLREVARLKGQDASKLQGLGLVVGLNGTGDPGSELVMARPLMQVLAAMGNPLPSLADLENTRSVALVMVTCTVSRTGAKQGDTLDIRVATLHSATDLSGGVLLAAPLVVPTPGGASSAYAIASGSIVVEDPERPTVGRVSGGADVIREIATSAPIRGSFDLILDPHIAGWGPASEVANEINQQYLLTAERFSEPLAVVVDPRTVRVRVPEPERPAPAAFVGDVLGTDISSALRRLPAKVICNTRTGAILVTGDVRVSPAVITHRDLTISTTVPPPIPDELNPLTFDSQWAAVETDAREPEAAQLEDLLGALGQLQIPASEQILILQMLHDAGKLHAQLVIDGE